MLQCSHDRNVWPPCPGCLRDLLGRKVRALTTVYDDPCVSGEYRLDMDGRRESLPAGTVGTIRGLQPPDWGGTTIVTVQFPGGLRASLGASAFELLEDNPAV